MKKASHVVSVWNKKELIGIIRSVGDSKWSENIDCLIVKPEYQNQGIGSILLNTLLNELTTCRYINVCPDDKDVLKFYEKFNFKIVEGFYLQRINKDSSADLRSKLRNK